MDYDIRFGVYKLNDVQYSTIDEFEENKEKFQPVIKLQKVSSQTLEIRGC